ncbi:MAG: GEVED domain-containing protein [Marinirhabdus sp.]|nr:GEVED domain-containing protein [Marinirhabdus sp.]
MKLKLSVLLCFIAMSFGVTAQEQGASVIATADGHTYVSPLSTRMNQLTPATTKGEAQDGRAYRKRWEVVPGKGKQADILSQEPHQYEQKTPGRTPDLVFTSAFSNSQPTDPSIAVGPNHVFAVFNTGFAIYDKDGVELVGQTSPNPAIFPSSGCCDLTVSYDPVATSASNPTPGRWVVSFLGNGAQIAVSDGPDPVNDGWNVYNISTINDYQKLSVWSDGYYVTDQSNGNRVYAMERQAMLNGEPAGNVSIQGFQLPNFFNQGFASVQVLNISDDQYPGPGNATVVFFQDDAYPGVSEDSIKFWDLDVDFDTPANSTISAPQEVTVTPFTSIFDGTAFNNLSQPNGGADIDALQGIIMNQAQYKKFPTYNSAVFNFVIDVGTGNEQAAIRWYEFRQSDDGEPWVLEQEGTFADPEGAHFWHGSMIMDNQGNIGMGFSRMANAATGNGTSNSFVSTYYTGRFASTPNGTMELAPQLIFQGTANIPGIRYGDYSKIDIDPTDYQTMYFVNELMQPQRSNVVGRFKIAPDFANDVGVIDFVQPTNGVLTANETVEVLVRNFGTDPQTNVPISYTVDGGTPVVEVIAGPIPAATTINYTFTATADLSTQGQTYTLESCTALVGDENPANDCFIKDVSFLEPDDVGVTSIDEPVSGGLGATETITVTITNFGTATQTSIPVFYTIDGGTPVQETYTGSIAIGETDTYSFTQTADLSVLGDYDIVAGTELAGDSDTTNDDVMVTVTSEICMPTSDCAGFNDGVTQIQLADQDINTNCGTSPAGYSDDTDIVFNFVLSDNPFEGTLQMGFADSVYALWIDFNDNNTFEPSELVANDFVPNANTDFNFTIDFADFPEATTGMHRMRLRGEDEDQGGNVLDPCDDLTFGRTNDYTANITGEILSVESQSFSAAEFLIVSLDNNRYELSLNTNDITDDLPVFVYNVLGQQLAFYSLEHNGNGYSKIIDMSYVSSGVYFVRVGKDKLNKVKRIIVE